MSAVQIGNGWLDIQHGKYTTYDANTGQLVTRALKGDPRDIQRMASDPHFISDLQNGRVDINQYLSSGDSNYLGGRSNVNVSRQVAQAMSAIQSKYPQMDKATAVKYANQWVNDRIAHGWDANEVENMMKDVTRNDNSINQDFLNGVTSNISFDEFNAKPDDATAPANPEGTDPRGSIQDELRAFAGHMMSTLPPDSPQVQRIAELAAAAGNKYATASGLGPGGITATGVANTAARANVDLQTQREGIGAQALAAAGNQQLSVDQLNTQLQQGNQQANTLQGSNVGGLIGSGVGLVGGLVASAYGGGAALPGLVAGGGAAGQAIGGTIANGAQPPIKYGGAGQQQSSYRGKTSWGTS